MKSPRLTFIDMSDYNQTLRVYWWAAVSAALLAGGWSIVSITRMDPSARLAVYTLMGFAAAAGFLPTRVPGTQVLISPGDVFVFLAALIYGPAAATLVAGTEALCVSYRTSRRWTSRLGGPAFQMVAIFLSASLLSWALARLRSGGPLGNTTLIATLFAFSAVYFFLNTMFVGAHHSLKQGVGLISHWRHTYPWTSLSYLAGASIAGFVYLALRDRAFAVLLGVAPLVAVIFAMSRFFFKQAEEKARAGERISLIVNNISEVLFAFDLQGRASYVNPAITELTGYSVDEALSMDFLSLVHQDYTAAFQAIWLDLTRGESRSKEDFKIQTKTGKPKWCSGSWGPLRDTGGRHIGIQGYLRDISEHKALQFQLVQSQKMEAVGLLAGGIAHDFNNLLTAMTGYSQLALAGLEDNDPVKNHVNQFYRASTRAASLTGQLLAFARRQALKPVVLDMNSLVKEVDQLLLRVLGPDIELVPVFSPHRALVKADPGQIEQVIVNLAVNARDAMSNGGRLTIRVGGLRVADAEAARGTELVPGDYVTLSVSDTGSGMSAETAARIFEPFFTTKEVGKGTGLGLSTVYGIAKQSEGHIAVESELGRGSTFKLCLPKVESQLPDFPLERGLPAERPRSGGPSGNETILVVDDDEGPRKMVAAVLTGAGYKVLEASSAAAALTQCRELNGPIHLMVTDLVMPQVGGIELAERAATLRPGMRVLLMSGRPDEVSLPGISLAETPFLQKPFSIDALSRKVRELLDQPGERAQPRPTEAATSGS